AGALRNPGRVLRSKARPLPRTAAGDEAETAAGAGRLFPAGRLFRRERPGRRRLLPLADRRTRRHRDPAVAVLRNPARRPAACAAVLRQERDYPRCGHRAPEGIVMLVVVGAAYSRDAAGSGSRL